MTASSAAGSRTRVLIADDERVIADTLRIILEQHGFAAAYGGASAVERAQSWRPDVFLSDILMPEMNGVEAAIRICDLLPECRVLLLTGAGPTGELVEEARERGYRFSLVLKPVHPAHLVHLLQRMERKPPVH